MTTLQTVSEEPGVRLADAYSAKGRQANVRGQIEDLPPTELDVI